MIERRKRGTVRTGTAALGVALIVMALTASPVGAIPFEGEDTGQFWFAGGSDSNEDGIPGTSSLISGYNTLAGASQCFSYAEYQLAPEPSGNCDGVEFSSLPGGWSSCQNEDGGVIWSSIIDATSCLPFSCFDENSNLVVGCTATVRAELNILGGTGMYANATGSYTSTGTSTYTTPSSGTSSWDTTGDIMLAGDAPPNDVFLEIPTASSTQSGVGVVAGWSCLGGHLEVEFSETDGTPILTDPLQYGVYRPTTEDDCGDIYNGFSMLINWSRLGPGEKTLTLFVNGEERVTRNFFVTTFGEEVVTDAGGMCEIADFRDGQNATFVWQQENQGLVLVESLN